MTNSTSTTANDLSTELLNKLCETEVCRASSLSLALETLVEPLEQANLWGLAHIVELLKAEANDLCDAISEIPTKAKREDAA